MSHQPRTGKRHMKQHLPQTGKAARHVVGVHYSGACGCRNCRRLRAKARRKATS